MSIHKEFTAGNDHYITRLPGDRFSTKTFAAVFTEDSNTKFPACTISLVDASVMVYDSVGCMIREFTDYLDAIPIKQSRAWGKEELYSFLQYTSNTISVANRRGPANTLLISPVMFDHFEKLGLIDEWEKNNRRIVVEKSCDDDKILIGYEPVVGNDDVSLSKYFDKSIVAFENYIGFIVGKSLANWGVIELPKNWNTVEDE